MKAGSAAEREVGSSAGNRRHRGEPVIHDVIEAAREELARVGYRALRIEDVAARAKVNKTTIYRRWPTKVELVQETLKTMFDHQDPVPNTGSLRSDLLCVAGEMFDFFSSANGHVMVRMMMTEGTEKDLRRIVDSLRKEKDALAEHIFARARARGEIREDLDTELLFSTILGCLQHRMFALGLVLTKRDLEELVDLLLYGAALPKVPAKKKARRASNPKVSRRP